jgi:hypothetical protein
VRRILGAYILGSITLSLIMQSICLAGVHPSKQFDADSYCSIHRPSDLLMGGALALASWWFLFRGNPLFPELPSGAHLPPSGGPW